jgi:hypothetical protein
MKTLFIYFALSAILIGAEALKIDPKKILEKADIISSSKVGYEGVLSDKGWALNYIIEKSEDAQSDFKEIWRNSETLYGKIYAIIGLLECRQGSDLTDYLNLLDRENVKMMVQINESVEWMYVGDLIRLVRTDEIRKKYFVVNTITGDSKWEMTSGKLFAELEAKVDAVHGDKKDQPQKKNK